MSKPQFDSAHYRSPAFLGLMAAIPVLLALGFVLVAVAPETYDFPMARDVEKAIEDVTNGTGSSVAVEDFVTVTDAPVAASSPGSPSGAGPASPLPARIRIQVPFLIQAPTGNWDMPFQEACEEASMLMVHHYLAAESAPAGAEAEREIRAMVDWENEEFNYSADITMEEAKRIAEDYWSHRAQLFYDFTIDDMKRLLAEGHPIIVPLAGRDIGNPYYSGEGPWYHMLVITGYDGDQFITNDPGTKRGEGYRYPTRRLYDAIHNWTGVKEDIRNGRRVMMVLER